MLLLCYSVNIWSNSLKVKCSTTGQDSSCIQYLLMLFPTPSAICNNNNNDHLWCRLYIVQELQERILYIQKSMQKSNIWPFIIYVALFLFWIWQTWIVFHHKYVWFLRTDVGSTWSAVKIRISSDHLGYYFF